jgi:hypothetical protein
MGTIDANGIYFYEETDAVSPLHTLLNTGQQSVSDAFDGTTRIYPVSNTTTRNALATGFTPSTTDPLLVYRADAKQIESNDGTGWIPQNARAFMTNARTASYAMGANSTMYVLGGSGSSVPVFGVPDAYSPMALVGSTYSNEVFSWNQTTGIVTPIQATGMYEIEFRMQASPLATGTVTIGITKNTASIGGTSNDLARDDRANSASVSQYLYAKTRPLRLTSSDQIRFISFIFGAAGAVTLGTDPNQTWFTITRVGA